MRRFRRKPLRTLFGRVLVGLAAFGWTVSQASAAPPLPPPYPTPTPVGSIPDPTAWPGGQGDLPAPLPRPLATSTPNDDEVAAAGGELPGGSEPYDYVLVEDTPQNRRWFKENRYTLEGWEEGVQQWEEDQRDAMAPRLAVATGKYIVTKLGMEGLGKALPYFRNIYLVGKKAHDTGSVEETLHETVRAVFRVGGGAVAGGAAGASGVGLALIIPAQIIGTTVGAGAAEVIIWTGVTLGDATRYAYDNTRGARQTINWLKEKLTWESEPPPPSQPGPGPAPAPLPTPTPSEGGVNGGSSAGGSTGGSPGGSPGGATGGNGQGGAGDENNPPGQAEDQETPPSTDSKDGALPGGSQLPTLPTVDIPRPPGWGA